MTEPIFRTEAELAALLRHLAGAVPPIGRAGDVPLLATVSNSARLLDVNRRTIYKLVAAGKLELVKIGPRSSRITGASLLRLAGVKED